MKILSVKINNILSIEDAYVEFDDSGLMLVQGWNHDVGRANGAGKTAVFNAIAFALYDKLPRKITASEILRRGSKSGYVEVKIACNGCELVVKRTRPKGVTFFKEGQPQTITQEEWENSIGLNYDQFIISMYCAQGTSSRFLSLNDADKKTFLLQLLNLEKFSSCKAIADQKLKAFDQELISISNKEFALEAKIDAYSESLIDEHVYAHNIDILNEVILEKETAIRNENVTTKPDFSKYQVIEDNIITKRTEFTKLKTKREMLHDQYRKINSKIRPFNASNICLSCGTKLDTSAAEVAHSRACEEHTRDAAAIKQQIDECDALLLNEGKIKELADKLAAKKKEESKEYEAASLRLSELNKILTLKRQELKELVLKVENNKELINKINILSSDLEELKNKKREISSAIELYKTVSSIYSPTGAQAYILDSIIDSFNEQVVNYVGVLWSNLSYTLQSYKENIKGDVTAKFSEHLTMDGKPISIGSLSGGEFRALSLCIDFALIDVMERQFGISMSPVTLDEPFDGLDSVGREVIVDLLEAIGQTRQVVVIDHTSEVKSMFSKVLTVEKKNGVSSVKLET